MHQGRGDNPPTNTAITTANNALPLQAGGDPSHPEAAALGACGVLAVEGTRPLAGGGAAGAGGGHCGTAGGGCGQVKRTQCVFVCVRVCVCVCACEYECVVEGVLKPGLSCVALQEVGAAR